MTSSEDRGSSPVAGRARGRRPAAAGGRRPGAGLLARAGGVALLAVALAGCDQAKAGRFGFPSPITVQGHRVLGLWVGSTWAALTVGAFVITLTLWACFRFRKRTEVLPRQVHYNLPIEILYTLVPFVMISVLFYFTAVDETYIDKLSKKPGVKVTVTGFRWSWQFSYPDKGLQVTGRPGRDPVLTLPVGRSVQFLEVSPDVIHSFWVPAFLFKRDVIPGHPNRFEVTVNRTGWFDGYCAEFCGVYHSRMLFRLHVVTPSEYDAWLSDAKAQAATGNSPIYSTIGASTNGSSS